MKTLLRYLKSYTLYCVLGPLFKLLEVVFELYVPLLIRDLIEYGINQNNKDVIIRCVIKVALFALFGFASALTAQWFAAKASARAVGNMRKDLFDHIQQFSFSQLELLGKSSLFSRLTVDMNQVQSGVNLALRLLLRSPFVVFGAMIMAFTVNVRSAVYFAILIPVMFMITFSILLYTIPLMSRSRQQLDKVVTVTRENLTGSRVIRAFRHEPEEIRHFQKESTVLSNLLELSSNISLLLNPITTILVNIFIILMIRNGRLQFFSGSITQGEVLALYNYMSMILVELIKLANLIITLTRSVASADRIQAVFEIVPDDIPEKVSSFFNEPSKGIHFEKVSFSYPNSNVPTLNDITFEIGPGETVGIIGGIGSGKTTLGHLIAGYYRPTRGTVSLFGNDTRTADPVSLRNHIGFVFQKTELSSGTIRSNLLWSSCSASDDEMVESLQIAQAWDFLKAKNGLDTEVERDGKNYSGGQKQRISIARALIRKPELLVFDDSASALDFMTESNLRASLSRLPWNPIKVIISQRIASIEHADIILVLDKGELVGAGKHSDLLKSCKEYRDIAMSQGMEETA